MLLVIQGGALANGTFNQLFRQDRRRFCACLGVGGRQRERSFENVQGRTGISTAVRSNQLKRIVISHPTSRMVFPLLFQHTLEQADDAAGPQTLEGNHMAARKQRIVEVEGGVFRRGTKEDDGAILHIGQKRVLLGFVEAVNLIHEQKRVFASAVLGLGDHFPDFVHPCRCCGEGVERKIERRSNEADESCFACAGRSPEQQTAWWGSFRQNRMH
eukprot:GCRY01006194.1.p1 GENE.GCRY01006194.1~~GCRY01006194.1.p1  ORF type:complete len:215 (-),score=36.12 GCRY01006194.1:711-1355(-)